MSEMGPGPSPEEMGVPMEADSSEAPPGITNYPETEQRERIGQLMEACSEVLDDEALASFEHADDWDETIIYAYTALLEAGVDDPEAFLKEKGVLE